MSGGSSGCPEFSPWPPQKPAPGARDGAPWHRDSGEPAKAIAQHPDNARKAAWLWGIREPLSETNAAGLYLRRRGYGGAFPATLGYLRPNGKHPPAMIAAFGFCEEPEPGVIDLPAVVRGVHLTRLTMDGEKAPIDLVKIMVGPSAGLPIVLAQANDLLGLAITEGIEDGLSVLPRRVLAFGRLARPAICQSLQRCFHLMSSASRYSRIETSRPALWKRSRQGDRRHGNRSPHAVDHGKRTGLE